MEILQNSEYTVVVWFLKREVVRLWFLRSRITGDWTKICFYEKKSSARFHKNVHSNSTVKNENFDLSLLGAGLSATDLPKNWSKLSVSKLLILDWIWLIVFDPLLEVSAPFKYFYQWLCSEYSLPRYLCWWIRQMHFTLWSVWYPMHIKLCESWSCLSG